MGSGYRVFTAGEVLTASNVQNYLQDQAVMVFAGTAARTTAIGTANFEEGMLTYLTDVDKLQVYTGAAFADVYPPTASSQGLTLISTTSFSGVASQSVNDVFSATYNNYKILLNNFTGSTGNVVNIRLRVSGADASGANYNRELVSISNTTVSAVRNTGLTSFEAISRIQGSTPIMTDIHLVNPFVASETTAKIMDTEGQVGTSINVLLATFNHTLTTSYTGFTLIAASGTMSGSVSVYGYNI